jgi:hypothetical protein
MRKEECGKIFFSPCPDFIKPFVFLNHQDEKTFKKPIKKNFVRICKTWLSLLKINYYGNRIT